MSTNRFYDSAVDGELFALRWRDATTEGLELLDEQLAAHHRALGKPLYYVAIIDSNSPRPDEVLRRRILDGLSSNYRKLQAVRLVILGSGLRATLMRSAITAMMLLAGRRGQPFKVDRSIWDTARHIAVQLNRDVAGTIAWFRSTGLVDADEIEQP